MPLSVIPEPPQESRRVDYATAVFVSASAAHQREVFDFCVSVGEQLSDVHPFSERGSSPHFDRVFTQDLGIRIELTEYGSGRGRNPGMTVLTLPGAAFYLQDTEHQMLMLWKVVTADGFKWFSRIDLQNTELEPLVDADAVQAGVESRRYWVKGYGSWRPYGQLSPDGSCPGGRTIYWGSTRAERQGRTYDKGKQAGWKVPAIRDEIQFRGDWAHSIGREIKQAVDGPHGSDAMNKAVCSVVTSALNQHLQYWELNGADPKTDKNWQRKANPADWYLDRIGKDSKPVRKAPRPTLDLEGTVSYGVQQYGRYFALWVADQMQRSDVTFEEALELLWLRLYCRLKPEDIAAFLALPPGEMVDVEMADIEALKDALAEGAEQGWFAGE